MQKLSWKTVEYLHHEKTTDWYWIVGIVTISLAIIAVILGNLIFGIFIIVASFTLSLFASRKPGLMSVSIDSSGVSVGKTHYPFTELDSFWIETREGEPKLILKSKKIFSSFIVAYINEVEVDKVYKMLIQDLPEEEHIEPILEKLLIYLGF